MTPSVATSREELLAVSAVHISRFLSAFVAGTDQPFVVEVRAFGVNRSSEYPHTRCGYFQMSANKDDMKVLYLALRGYIAEPDDRQPEAIYITLNPVTPALLARANGVLKKVSSKSTISATDKDVTERRWLLIDVDPVRPAGISASDAEKAAAREVTDAVRNELASKGWPDPMFNDSGNGYHLWYRIDLPADDERRVERCLKALAATHNTHLAAIDTCVFNPSRIAKLPGTCARKGDSRPDRPHRMARVITVPDRIEVVLPTLIDHLAASFSIAAAPKAVTPIGATRAPVRRGAQKAASAVSRCRAYLDKVNGAVSGQHGHDRTYEAARIIWNDFGLDEVDGLDLLSEYNAKCDPPWSEKELRHKWDSAVSKGPGPEGRGHKLREGNGGEQTRRPAVPPTPAGPDAKTYPPPNDGECWDDPHRIARLFLNEHRTKNGDGTFVQFREEYYEWNGAAYQPLSDSDLDARLASHARAVHEADMPLRIEEAWREAAEAGKDSIKQPSLYKVTSKAKGDIRLNLAALANHQDRGDDPPFWLAQKAGDRNAADVIAADVIAAPNGLFTLDGIAAGKSAFAEPTPRLFTPNALAFPVTQTTDAPSVWLRCLQEWFTGDQASILGLQEWFGYLLAADTSLHKVLFLVGPRRSGKGTILDTLTKLVGAVNVASTTFATLGESFGLESLIGKRVAIIPDGRLSGRTDTAAVVERLLSISGEDAQSVNRKNRRRITARLRIRFVIASNEIPRLPDASGALASRFHILHTPNSWFGKEDRTLKEKLVAELPGILVWAAQGWVRLQQQGAFTGNTAAEQYATQLADLSSPIRAFVRDACWVGPEHTVDIPTLFVAWREWNEQRHRECGSEAVFGRDLKAACPHIRASQRRSQIDGTRVRTYFGISLRDRQDWGCDDSGASEVSRDVTRDKPTQPLPFFNTDEDKKSPACVGLSRVTSRDSNLDDEAYDSMERDAIKELGVG